MTLQNKILPVALVAALLGGSVGALVTRSRNAAPAENQVASANLLPNGQTQTASQAESLRYSDAQPAGNNQPALNAPAEENAYREGFTDGFTAARDTNDGRSNNVAAGRANTVVREQVVYRDAPARTRTRYVRSSPRRVYYDYEPRKRSFWQKHRDKLTVAMGAGAGAAIGGLVGGKKGALIGGLAGGGGSALYTYKLRKRNRY